MGSSNNDLALLPIEEDSDGAGAGKVVVDLGDWVAGDDSSGIALVDVPAQSLSQSDGMSTADFLQGNDVGIGVGKVSDLLAVVVIHLGAAVPQVVAEHAELLHKGASGLSDGDGDLELRLGAIAPRSLNSNLGCFVAVGGARDDTSVRDLDPAGTGSFGEFAFNTLWREQTPELGLEFVALAGIVGGVRVCEEAGLAGSGNGYLNRIGEPLVAVLFEEEGLVLASIKTRGVDGDAALGFWRITPFQRGADHDLVLRPPARGMVNADPVLAVCRRCGIIKSKLGLAIDQRERAVCALQVVGGSCPDGR